MHHFGCGVRPGGAELVQKIVTVRDIATAVGVSVATVSNVLNERPNVRANNRRLTTIAQPVGAIGAKAVELVLEPFR